MTSNISLEVSFRPTYEPVYVCMYEMGRSVLFSNQKQATFNSNGID